MSANRNANRLAAWLYVTHPKVFSRMLAEVKAKKVAAGKLSGMRGSFGRFGQTGTTGFTSPTLVGATQLTSDIQNVGLTSTVGATGATNPFAGANVTPDVTMQNVTSGITSPIGPAGGSPAGSTSGSTSASSSSSGGFWSGIEKAIAPVSSAVSAVGSFLGTPEGLTALATVGGAVVAATEGNSKASDLTAQTELVAQGQSPAPVTYSATGTPLLSTASGPQPISSISSLLGGAPGMGSMLPIIIIAIIAAFALSKA
jgi:hypothetical protein